MQTTPRLTITIFRKQTGESRVQTFTISNIALDRRYNVSHPTRPPLQLIHGDQQTFNRLISDESFHNLGYVRDRDVPVKKVIGFD